MHIARAGKAGSQVPEMIPKGARRKTQDPRPKTQDPIRTSVVDDVDKMIEKYCPRQKCE